MSWITLVEDDLHAGLSPLELAAFQANATGAGGANPATAALERATAEVRGSVAACNKNQLGATGTIPDELKGAAVDLAVYYIVTSISISDEAVLKNRTERKNDAQKLLARVASCAFAVAQPETTGSDVIARPQLDKVSGNDRQVTRSSMGGL